MSKEISIGVPRAGQASHVPSFAVSRDSAGILIGVRDPAAPQFAVSRNADGLLLSAWPVAPAVPAVPVVLWNYVQNPRFHVGTESWGAIGDLDRVTDTPFGLPPGADAAARFTGSGYFYTVSATCGSVVVSESTNLPMTVTFGVEGVEPFTTTYLYIELTCLDDENKTFYGPISHLYYIDGINQWHTQTDVFFVPFGTDHALLSFNVLPAIGQGGTTPWHLGYITLVRLGGATYADGDSAEWTWLGTVHNSNSRKLS